MALYWPLANTAVICVYVSFVRLLVRGAPWWVLLQHYYIVAKNIFHSRVWYRPFFFCAMRVFEVQPSSSSPKLYTFAPNFVSLVASIAEIAHGEKSRRLLNESITHPAYLMPRQPKLGLWNSGYLEDLKSGYIWAYKVSKCRTCQRWTLKFTMFWPPSNVAW